jgi:Zn-dependent M28 family amino/carboxypeptidase
VGVDETLVGDQIYNGADDNAASVAAVLTIAKVLANSGKQPLRTVVFALWDGEEVNYLGSDYFAQNFEHIKQVQAYVNLDMIAKNGFVPILYPEFKLPDRVTDEINATGNEFHFLYTKELENTAKQLVGGITENKLDITPKLRIMEHKSRGSDYLPFSVQGVPVAWFFTGLHDQYHTPADEVQAVDIEKVTNITKATLLIVDKLANE